MPKLTNKKFHVVLIKPSKYDDAGFVIQYFRGVLPSNTLSCLYELTESVNQKKLLGKDVDIQTHVFDETVESIDIKKIARLGKKKDSQVVVCLVGVQSNQFPRSSDLAISFRKEGVKVLIGGFHVSGNIAIFKQPTPEIQYLIDNGVTVVAGEVEDAWGDILKDTYNNQLQPLYNYLDAKPDMRFQPIPGVHKEYLKRFAFSNFGTIDCGRGCPFNCSFCTIINVQGRTMRNRDPQCIRETVILNYREKDVNYYFFTDDNFSRNKNWEQIFDMLIELREKENITVFFMMQIDVLSYKIPNFLEKARKAGCTQVFIGMESINEKNLAAVDKKQNKVSDYAHMIHCWHQQDIATHVGYIIGFPFDSPESVREDIRILTEEIKVQQASFFMLTPLPGSLDHYNQVQSGAKMDTDLNKFDSFHPVTEHPNFPEGSWFKTYQEAWNTFYSKDNMKAILSAAGEFLYWRTFMNFIWYKSAMIEGEHPMISGFFRLKNRLTRRPGYAVETRLQHIIRRVKETKKLIIDYWGLFLEMEEVWLATRIRSEREKKLIEEWNSIKARIPHVKRHRSYVWRRINVFSFKGVTTRVDMKWYWARTKIKWRKRQLNRIKFFELIRFSLREAKLNAIFAYYLLIKKIRHSTSLGNI